MRARSLKRLGLILVALVLALGAAEGVSRLRAPSAGEELLFSAPDAAPSGLYRASTTLLTEPVPGFTGEVQSLGYRVPLRINSLGLRGAEPGQGRRWLALGDSFTIAVQVPEEQTFAARIGASLGVEVLNGGVDGYSTWQATIRYRALDDVVRAEAVLLTFFLGNDLSDNERVQVQLRAPPNQHPPPMLSRTDPVTRWLFRNSVAFAYARVAFKRAALTRGDGFESRRFKEELLPFTKPGATRLQELLRQSERALLELRDLTRSRGDRLIVTVAPASFAMDPERAAQTLATFGLTDPDVDAPRRAVVELLGRLGITSCDLTPALQAAETAGKAPYFRFDGHWTDSGHAAVAEAVLGCLR